MRSLSAVLPFVILLAACGGDGDGGGGDGGTVDVVGGGGIDATPGGDAAPAEDLDMRPEDFDCILNWDQVRLFRITNKLGHTAEALAVANNPAGGDYPVGTVIQLVPNEAMVKRYSGWNTTTRDWEFFFLDTSASGTTITTRGATDVTNQFGGNCFDCHNQAMPQWDLVCEDTHGCDPLPFSDQQLLNVQNGDPRCP